MTETYRTYRIEPLARLTRDGRYAVAVRISACDKPDVRSTVYQPEDRIAYILQVEAEKEAIRFARRLIDAGRL